VDMGGGDEAAYATRMHHKQRTTHIIAQKIVADLWSSKHLTWCLHVKVVRCTWPHRPRVEKVRHAAEPHDLARVSCLFSLGLHVCATKRFCSSGCFSAGDLLLCGFICEALELHIEKFNSCASKVISFTRMQSLLSRPRHIL